MCLKSLGHVSRCLKRSEPNQNGLKVGMVPQGCAGVDMSHRSTHPGEGEQASCTVPWDGQSSGLWKQKMFQSQILFVRKQIFGHVESEDAIF